jgi:hypothetical protein
MIQARRQRDEIAQTYSDLKKVVLAGVEEALAELGKQFFSKVMVRESLIGMRECAMRPENIQPWFKDQ